MTLTDALTCLAESPWNTIQLVTGIDRTPDTGAVKASKSGNWAYRTVTGGFRYQSIYTWDGWYSSPTGFVTWDDIDNALTGDPRIAAATTWAQTALRARPDGWRDVMRPYRFTPHPTTWHPQNLTAETQRPGWQARLHHWEHVITACREAANAQPQQLDLFDPMETT